MKAIISIVAIIIIFIMVQTSQVSAFSVRQLLGLDKPDQEQVENKPDAKDGGGTEWARTSEAVGATNPQIDLQYVEKLIANMKTDERQELLSDEAVFKQAIENEAINRSLLSAALANNMDKDSNVEFLMQRGAENVLRESYLNRLIRSKLPADFPSEAQITEYYENNKDKFVIPERIHVWQIFYQRPEDINAVSEVKQLATRTYKKLEKNNSNFSELAISQSDHEPSRANGGYMGLIKTDELIPEVKQALVKSKEGEISWPVESESGFHILKKGITLKPIVVELEQVQAQIRQLLLNQANTQLRQAVFAQASKEFPQSLTESKLEEWRLQLKTTDTVPSQ